MGLSARAQTTVLNPNADGHVRSGIHAATNFAALSSCDIKRSADPTDDFNREVYLKFNISGLPSTIVSAKVRIYGSASTAPESIQTELVDVPNTSWSESTLSWNAKPAAGVQAFGRVPLSKSLAWHEWDVTSYIQARVAASQPSAAFLARNTVASTTGVPSFACRESANYRPELVVTTGSSMTLAAVSDAHVRSGSHALTNFGSDVELDLKKSASDTDDFNREIYLKFSITDVQNIASAKLRIYGSDGGAPETVITEARAVTNTSWNEDNLTWANKPAAGEILSSQTLQGTDSWHEFDVTSYVKLKKAAGMPHVAFALLSQVASTTGVPNFNSSESSSNKPELVIMGSGGGDLTLPSISIANPTNGSTLTGPITATASASDNMGVVGVQFRLNGQNLGAEDTVAPYTASLSLAGLISGPHTLSAVARDAAGNRSTAQVNFNVNNTPSRGTAVPFSIYEAENAIRSSTASIVTGTSRGEVAFEARNKRAVVLNALGEYVQFDNVVGASHATIRFSLPDGVSTQLALYVNDVRRATYNINSNKMREPKPGQLPGDTVRFFDDAMLAVPGGIPAGARVKIQKDVNNTTPVTLDFLELETAPAPLTRPDSTWVIVDGYNENAIRAAINVAKNGSKKVWLPAGTYSIGNAETIVMDPGIQVRGAGMWHIILQRADSNIGEAGVPNTSRNSRIFEFRGNNTLKDLKVVSALNKLVAQNVAVRAVDGSRGHLVEGVWVEYIVLYLGYNAHDSVIRNNRVRNAYKDCIHIARTSSNNLVENNSFRNCGDDSVALVSYNSSGMRNNTIRNNTVELGYWGRGLTIIGGDGNRIENNVVTDYTAAGILVAVEHYSDQITPYATNFVVRNNTVTRSGNQLNGSYGGSIAVWAGVDTPISGYVENNDIISPPFHGSDLDGYVGSPGQAVYFRYNNIDAPVASGRQHISVTLRSGSNCIYTPNNLK